MFSMRNEKYLLGLLLMVSINLIYNISVTESQSTSKRNQVLGVNKKALNKDKQKEVTNAPKVKKDTESETQRAIEEISDTETTTLAIDFKMASNETINEILNEFEGNSTSNQSLLMFNETEITTPLFISSNVTTNDSLVSITVETPDYSNSTEYELLVNSTTQLTANYTNDTTLPSIIGYSITEMDYTETPIEMTDTLKESPILSSTISAVEALTQSSIDLDNGLNQEMAKCVFDKQIECKNYELICFGSGEVDCGQRDKRSAEELIIVENITDSEVFKSYLEKQSLSENIENSKCVLTAFENMYFACEPLPLINDCNGKSICKPTGESTDLNEGLPFWKVGLISALTAIGAICFIIVAVIAYVSYNKLKIRPESSTNGYHNNPQNVTRV